MAAGARSWNRSSCKTASTLARSSELRARAGAGAGAGRSAGKGRSGGGGGGGGGGAQEGPLPIEGSAGHPQEIAGGHDAHRGRQMGDGVHQGFSSGSAFGSGHPNSAPT